MQQSKVLETWVGLFVALGLVAVFFMAMQVSNLSDIKTNGRSYRITARFANAGSLKVRAPVSMAGVRLGRVESIHFDKDSYEAVVEMSIDPAYDTLPEDTTATVLTQGLLGEQYVGLTPGGAAEYLKDGDELELTQSAMVLEEVISRFLFDKAEGRNGKSDSEDESAKDDKEARDVKEPQPLLKPRGDEEDAVEKEETQTREIKRPKPSMKPRVEVRPQAPAQLDHAPQPAVRRLSPTPQAAAKKPPVGGEHKPRGSEAPK